MNRRTKPQPPRRQLFFHAKDQLIDEYYAVVRITWFSGNDVGVFETSFHSYEPDAVAEIPSIVEEALIHGADVSVICVESMEDLGLKPK